MHYSHRWLNLLLRLRPVHRPAKKKKAQAVQGLAAGRNALASSASDSSISTSRTASTGSLTANTDSDAISMTTVPGTPGEDDAGVVLWSRPSIGAFGEGNDTQERECAIAKNGKSTVYRDRTAAKVRR
jgi:hypothetical protein